MAGNHYSNKVKIILQLGDLFFLNLAFIVSSYITTQTFSFMPVDQAFTFLIMINFIWYVLASYSDLYNIGMFIRIDRNIYKALFITTLHYTIVALMLYLIDVFQYTVHNMFVFYVAVYYSIFAGKILLLLGLKFLRQHKYYIRNVVILGGGKVGDEIKSLITSDYSFGYKYLGTYDDTPSGCQFKSAVAGSINDFKTFAIENKVDVAFIALPENAYLQINELIQFCDANAIRAKIIPDFMRYIRNRIKLDYYGSIPIILLREEPLESYRNQILKQSFDIIFSLIVILFVLSWLIPLLAILIKLDSKGPVFFTQHRTGLNNKIFNVIKFRIMHENVEADTKQTNEEDSRLTRLGGFLRKMNIDEFPQFINVLLGDMSVIGPRPHMLQETEKYSKIIDNYLVRHLVKPGITGWAQVNGFHGDTLNSKIMRGRVKCDVYYIENWSVLLDIRIFFKTIFLKNKALFEMSKAKDPIINQITGSLVKIIRKIYLSL
jgi:putative colanic acid biosynthesis UDP-glucose lipid carrier transferase